MPPSHQCVTESVCHDSTARVVEEVGSRTARVGAHPASAVHGALAARQWGHAQPVWAHTQRVRCREHLLPGSEVTHSMCGRTPSECGAGSTCCQAVGSRTARVGAHPDLSA
eukprot:349816-Chlamydomonas_euryale.AAC.2